jgi:hypothetical protein
VKLFLVWSGYHYSGQTKGIALLYARRLGIEVDRWTRGLMVAAIYGSWLYPILRVEMASWGMFYGVPVPTGIPWVYERLPAQFQFLTSAIAWGSVGALGAVFLVTAFRQGRIFPIAAAAPIAAQMLWYGPGSTLPSFYEFVPLFHSVQYLIIAWVFQLKEQSAEPSYSPTPQNVAWETFKWGTGVVLGGVVLFWVLPHAIAWRGYPLPLALACVNATIQVHHFFVDGVIWKIRDPRTRSMLGGNLYDLAGVPRTASL